MINPTPELITWGAFAGLIHGVIGYLVVDLLTPYRPRHGFIGGIFPDLDAVFLLLGTSFPFVHRGIMHTPFFLIVLLFLLWLFEASETVVHGVGIGFALHLILDTVSGWGIMWLWPLADTWIYIPWGINEMEKLAFSVIIVTAIIILRSKKRRVDSVVDPA